MSKKGIQARKFCFSCLSSSQWPDEPVGGNISLNFSFLHETMILQHDETGYPIGYTPMLSIPDWLICDYCHRTTIRLDVGLVDIPDPEYEIPIL